MAHLTVWTHGIKHRDLVLSLTRKSLRWILSLDTYSDYQMSVLMDVWLNCGLTEVHKTSFIHLCKTLNEMSSPSLKTNPSIV